MVGKFSQNQAVVSSQSFKDIEAALKSLNAG